MTQRRRIILQAALFGALAGVLATRKGHLPFDIHAIADNALLAHPNFLIAAGLGWVAFSVYWEIAARNEAAAKSTESGVSRGIHILLANLALALVFFPIRGLGRFLPASTLIMTAGLVVEGLGLFLTIWARRCLGRNWSGEISIKVDHELIRSGPYKLLRHPIYTGLLTMYVGTAVVAGTWLALIGLAMAAFAYWRKIRLEEKNLNVAFGTDYDAYRRETWALIPGLF